MSKKNKNWKKNQSQTKTIEKENGKTAGPKKETTPACVTANRVRHYDVAKETTLSDNDNWPALSEHNKTRSRKALWYTVNGKFRCLM